MADYFEASTLVMGCYTKVVKEDTVEMASSQV